MRRVMLPVTAAAALLLSGCAGSGPDAAEEKIDENTAIAQCGMMTRMLTGEADPTPENIEDLKEVMTTLADEGYGPVKNMAAALLPSFDGDSPLDEADAERLMDEFKAFCKDYTVD
ncbi:hypothetical protein [Arthrobacter mobilis]|uniref:Lipoprotein n=1 Tax=Arthrobacter mobilis TaxID=2724944 RepID=A0A7X6K518_9MICC|nr:hypothetical protein [Arthrobacter mobilis]NKX55987.1 hypothetical protein [Arthrobacter mobilis]